MDSGNIEYAYSLMAEKAGVEMAETRLFKTDAGDSFFGIKRFDRKDNQRFHVHTFGNMIHADFRVPSVDYDDFFKIIKVLTKNHLDLLRAYRQMIFNILVNNRDDHVKNYSFMIGEDGEWSLSPAYDITFSDGPGGEHSMTVLGEGKKPGKKEIITIGKKAGLSRQDILNSIDQVVDAVDCWSEYAGVAGVTCASEEFIRNVIGQNISRL